MWPGEVSPTCAFMFAPSMYTWPPWACTVAQMSLIVGSNTPCVDGYVIISAARSAAWAAALAERSATSMLPEASQATGTTLKPHIAAEAGFVPWAEVGIRQTWRRPSPRDSW